MVNVKVMAIISACIGIFVLITTAIQNAKINADPIYCISANGKTALNCCYANYFLAVVLIIIAIVIFWKESQAYKNMDLKKSIQDRLTKVGSASSPASSPVSSPLPSPVSSPLPSPVLVPAMELTTPVIEAPVIEAPVVIPPQAAYIKSYVF